MEAGEPMKPYNHSPNRRLLILSVLGLVLLVGAAAMLLKTGQAVTSTADRRLSAGATQPIYGVNFISSAEDRAPGSGRLPASIEQQYQNGLATGATWNRWPLYWFNIEQSPGAFNWSTQDATIQADIAHGLQLNAILLGTPPFYTTSPSGARSFAQPQPRQGGLSLECAGAGHSG